MLGHCLEVFFKLFEVVGGVENEAEVFEVFVKSVRDSFAEIDVANRFGVYFLHSLIEALDSILDELELRLLVLSDEELVKLEVVAVFITEGIRFNIFEELSPMLIILKTKKVLDAI
jgi:hypothetical protein